MVRQELYDMCKSIIDLNKQRYVIIKDEVDYINYYREQNDPEGVKFMTK